MRVKVAKTARGCMQDRRCVRNSSMELAHDVVEQRDAHEQHQKRKTDLLAEHLRPLGERGAFEPFGQLKHDLPAVENRDREKVQEAETQRDQYQKTEERSDAASCGFAGEFRDGERAAEIFK